MTRVFCRDLVISNPPPPCHAWGAFSNLKEPIMRRQEMLTFCHESQHFLTENSQPFVMIWSFWGYLKLSPWTPLYISVIFEAVCLFPMALWTHKWDPENQNIYKKLTFLPKSWKINKNLFVFKFLPKIFRIPPEVPWVWFLSSYD